MSFSDSSASPASPDPASSGAPVSDQPASQSASTSSTWSNAPVVGPPSAVETEKTERDAEAEPVPVTPSDPTIAQSVEPGVEAPVIAPAPPPVAEPISPIEPAVTPVVDVPVVQTKVELSTGRTVSALGVDAEGFGEELDGASGFLTLDNGLRIAVEHVVSYE